MPRKHAPAHHARADIERSGALGTLVGTPVRQEQVKLRAGGHGVLAEGVLVAQVVRD